MDEQKKPNVVKRVAGKIGSTAAKTAEGVTQGVQALAERREKSKRKARLKKYNPLFSEEYTSEEFHLPNVIRIVDDAERRGIDVCEGAIGWRSTEKNIEVFHLYDEAVAFSGLRFLPMPVCNKIYTVHPYNRNVFIAVDEYDKIVQQERLAELQEIAFCLGVKRYWVDVVAEDKTGSLVGVDNENKIGDASVDVNAQLKMEGRSIAQGKAFLVCRGKSKPQPLTLCWFKEDKNVEYLIKTRCSKEGKKMRVHTLVLHNQTNVLHSAIVSVAVKFGIKMKDIVKTEVYGKREDEQKQTMVVCLEF